MMRGETIPSRTIKLTEPIYRHLDSLREEYEGKKGRKISFAEFVQILLEQYEERKG